ncbi:alpha/beta hydrolase [Algicella marina]|uniref:alpha/beta hydrolase n=1 Tax=Algicella marina TaxID=2683284 RepID=UPI0032AFBAF9
MLIRDWDDAYANRDHIPGADDFVRRWPEEAAAFRAALGERAELDLAYGEKPRQVMDLFRPEGQHLGLLVFVHGGYWRMFDKSNWSHFAEGALASGWAVAMPSYTLAPEARISQITQEVTAAVEAAAGLVQGPVRLAGHSAGGHLVTRLVCRDSCLSEDVLERLERVTSISGVHDLRPMLRLAMNADLRLDAAESRAESPVLREPLEDVRVMAWVGADERPEFVRQTTLLANIWTGLGAEMAQVKDAGRHHFDVIDGLREADSPLMQAVLG